MQGRGRTKAGDLRSVDQRVSAFFLVWGAPQIRPTAGLQVRAELKAIGPAHAKRRAAEGDCDLLARPAVNKNNAIKGLIRSLSAL